MRSVLNLCVLTIRYFYNRETGETLWAEELAAARGPSPAHPQGDSLTASRLSLYSSLRQYYIIIRCRQQHVRVREPANEHCTSTSKCERMSKCLRRARNWLL